MITIKLPLNLSQEDKNFILGLQHQQSPIIRSAYAQAKQGASEYEVQTTIRTRFKDKLDSWFTNSSARRGIGFVTADDALGVRTRIFGGKKNLARRAKGLITNDEWKELRLMPVYLIGEAPKHGNRKFLFGEDSIIFKPSKGKKILLDLPVLGKKWSALWSSAVLAANEQRLPITVSLTSEHICLTFDETKIIREVEKKVIATRYAGIDMNPNFIGVSVFDGEKLIETKLFSLEQLTGKGASAAKLAHETREIGHSIGRYLTHLQVSKVFIEELNFQPGGLGKGRNLNRLCINQWSRSAFVAALTKHHKLHKINAAYTSTIGNILNPTLPDPIAASTAVAQRGYRLLVLKNKQFYPALPSHTYLKDLWKETEVPEVKDWPELHSWVKNSKVKYRVPIPPDWVFRKMSSVKSQVLQMDHRMT